MLLLSSGLVQTIQAYRLCWVSGRFGGGKTSLAFRLAREFLDNGYHLLTNTPSIWADDWDSVELDQDGHLRAVVIMDEAGLALKSTRQVEAMAAYAAKMDCIYFFPSFFPPIRAAQVLTIQPLFSFANIGIPLIWYRWRVKIGGFEDKGHFAWAFPQEVYGVYSRTSPETSIFEFVSYLSSQVEAFRKHYGVSDGLREVEGSVSETERFSDSVEALAEVADAWSSVPVRKGRRRGF